MKLPGSSWFSRHFRYLARLPTARFIIRVALESVIASFVVAVPLVLLLDRGTAESDTDNVGVMWMILWAPLLETLLFQTILVRIAQFFTRRSRLLVLIAWLPFAAAHFTNSIESGIAAGLVGGYFVAFTYVVWARRSHLKAFAATFAVHALGNATTVLLSLAFSILSALP